MTFTKHILAVGFGGLMFACSASATLVGGFEDSFSTGPYTWSVADGSYTAFDSFFATEGAKSIELWTARDSNAPDDADFVSDLYLSPGDFAASSFPGSAIFQDFVFGESINFSFDFSLDTFELPEYIAQGWNDYGFVSVYNINADSLLAFDVIAETSSIQGSPLTGNYLRALGPGSYRIGIGAMNRVDYAGDSVLAVDNVRVSSVPDGGSAAVLLFGSLAGLVACGRLRRAKRS